MVTVYGTYVTNLFFNPEKGQSTFLLKPAPESCKDCIQHCYRNIGKLFSYGGF